MPLRLFRSLIRNINDMTGYLDARVRMHMNVSKNVVKYLSNTFSRRGNRPGSGPSNEDYQENPREMYTKILEEKKKRKEKIKKDCQKKKDEEQLKLYEHKCMEDQFKALCGDMKCMNREEKELLVSAIEELTTGMRNACKRLALKMLYHDKVLHKKCQVMAKTTEVKKLLKYFANVEAKENAAKSNRAASETKKETKIKKPQLNCNNQYNKNLNKCIQSEWGAICECAESLSEEEKCQLKKSYKYFSKYLELKCRDRVLDEMCQDANIVRVKNIGSMDDIICTTCHKTEDNQISEPFQVSHEGCETMNNLQELENFMKQAKIKEYEFIRNEIKNLKADLIKKAAEEKARKECELRKKCEERLRKKSIEDACKIKQEREEQLKLCREEYNEVLEKLEGYSKRVLCEDNINNQDNTIKSICDKLSKVVALNNVCEGDDERKQALKAFRKMCEDELRKKCFDIKKAEKCIGQYAKSEGNEFTKDCEEELKKLLDALLTISAKDNKKECKKDDLGKQCDNNQDICSFRACLFNTLSEQEYLPGNKVSIIGTGAVGMGCAIALLTKRVTNNVALYDVKQDLCQAERLDLEHGSVFLNNCFIDQRNDIECTKDSRVVVVTTGTRHKPNESQEDAVLNTACIIRKLVPELVQCSPKAVFIILSNPADAMAWLARRVSNLPYERCFSPGCHLDTARFRMMIAQLVRVSTRSVHGFVLGEHGDSSVPLWSSVTVGGIRLQELLPLIGTSQDPMNWSDVHKCMVDDALDVIMNKCYANWSIGLTVSDIVSAIFENSNRVLSLSTSAKGICGIEDEVFLSLPCVVNRWGLSSVINPQLSELESKKLMQSAETLLCIQKSLQI